MIAVGFLTMSGNVFFFARQLGLSVAFLLSASSGHAQREVSLLTERPADSLAVFLAAPNDGSADATQALQAAIDQVQATTLRGIVFVPPGRYRLTSTVHLWSGIRLIGFGVRRPVLFLPANQPGFTESDHHRPLLFFASDKPTDPKAEAPAGNAGTFYSGLLNIDIELGAGNPAAVGVSFRVAQHGLMSHVRIDAADSFAAIENAGSLLTDLLLRGGHYGIATRQTAASWPFLLMDSELSGQSHAALRTSDAHPLLIRDLIRDVPAAIEIDTNHPAQLYLSDSTLLRVANGIVITGAGRPLGIVARHIFCDSVPAFTATTKAPAPRYLVHKFRIGTRLSPEGTVLPPDTTETLKSLTRQPPQPSTDVPPLPPSSSWRSLRDFGAAGDGLTDDTAALRRAIVSGRPIYVPQGRYKLSEPILLRPNTILIGLNPITTQFDLPDNTAAFSKLLAHPIALLTAPAGGRTIVSGIGVSTGGINPAAVALLWQAGQHSLVDDVRFLGGHGTALPNGHYRPSYNADHTADSDPKRPWDTEPPSLLVLHGGGTFRNIWSPSTYAAAGLTAKNTAIPTRVYLLSAEHHLRHEVTLDDVSHWQFFGLQTEAEKTEGAHGVPLAISASHNLLFANSVFYRVSRTTNPAPTAVTITVSSRIRFENTENRSGSAFPFDATLTADGTPITAPFFTEWTSPERAPTPRPPAVP